MVLAEREVQNKVMLDMGKEEAAVINEVQDRDGLYLERIEGGEGCLGRRIPEILSAARLTVGED